LNLLETEKFSHEPGIGGYRILANWNTLAGHRRRASEAIRSLQWTQSWMLPEVGHGTDTRIMSGNDKKTLLGPILVSGMLIS
jgi:hypothetical protein